MKINTTHSSKKKIAAVLATVLILVGVGSTFALTRQQAETPADIKSPTTEEQQQVGEDIKEQVIEEVENKPDAGSDPTPPPQEQEDGSKPVIGVNIVAISRNGDNYRVQTLIQYVTNSGQCALTITDSNNKTFRANADIQALPSSSTCKGFTIPVSELSAGKWSVNLEFENESVRGSVQKEMDVS